MTKKRIAKVDCFVEPSAAIGEVNERGGQAVQLQSSDMISKLLQAASAHFGNDNALLAYFRDRQPEFTPVDRQDDDRWRKFLDGHCEGMLWDRWYATNSGNRYNVVVFWQRPIPTSPEVGKDEIWKKVYYAVSPLNTTIEGGESIERLGVQAVDAVIDVFQLAPTPEGTVNQAILTVALTTFARQGDKRAIAFLKKVAAREVPLYPAHAHAAHGIASSFIDREAGRSSATAASIGHEPDEFDQLFGAPIGADDVLTDPLAAPLPSMTNPALGHAAKSKEVCRFCKKKEEHLSSLHKYESIMNWIIPSHPLDQAQYWVDGKAPRCQSCHRIHKHLAWLRVAMLWNIWFLILVVQPICWPNWLPTIAALTICGLCKSTSLAVCLTQGTIPVWWLEATETNQLHKLIF